MVASSILPELPSGSRVLVVRLRSIGDVVLLTPALRMLKRWRPDLGICVAIENRFRELLEGNPDVEEILEAGQGAGWRKAQSRLHCLREVRRRKFALCVNLHGGPASRLLTRASSAGCKVGFQHFRAPRLYGVLVPDARTILGQATVHTAEHQASAFFYLGLPRQEVPRARLFIRADHAVWWRKEVRRLAPHAEYALLHPTALFATKQWAPENFARLGTYLEREAGLTPLYSCGPGESAALDAIQQAAGSEIRRLEGLSLGQLAAALGRARLFVGNDSGPAHMAVALSRPSVVIFGSSSSTIWGPWPPQGGGPPAEIVQNFYDCNPCPGDRCYRFARPECILSVTFEQVRSKVDDVLTRSAQLSSRKSALL